MSGFVEDNINQAKTAYEELRNNFMSHQTYKLEFRIAALKNLLRGFEEMKPELDEALNKDLGLNRFMCLFSQHGRISQEINMTIKNLYDWAKGQSVPSILLNNFATSLIKYEPMGVVLIIGAWNYPYSVSIEPAISAIAAGNSFILKPSQLAPYTSNAMKKLFDKYMDNRFYRVVQGKIEVSKTLSQTPFDLICFTGSTSTGKLVAIEAAKNLTKVILELGGKCPAIVDSSAKIQIAVSRILFGKFIQNYIFKMKQRYNIRALQLQNSQIFINAGQTCIGVDHVYVEETVYEKFKAELMKRVEEMYGGEQNLIEEGNYSKIINQFHLNRLQSLLKDKHGGQIVYGGKVNRQKNFLYPTIVIQPSKDSQLMKDQIFGPILPVFRYSNKKDLIKEINSRPKPLAIYFFSQNPNEIEEVQNHTTSGSFCLNDTIIQISNCHLPFGGVGASGSGRYHGKSGFINFSNSKSVCRTKALSMYPNNERFMPYNEKRKKTMQFLMKFGFVEMGSLVKIFVLILVIILALVGGFTALALKS